jgi:arylformamidase
MKQWIYLSHIISENTPLYGGQGNVKIRSSRSIPLGDTSNNSDLQFPAHAGTHIDAPLHFDKFGESLEKYPAEFWYTENAWLIEYNVANQEVIKLGSLINYFNKIPSNCELLIIKTGFEKKRVIDSENYIFNGPGLSSEIGKWLRENRKLKFIGFDFISLSSFSDREEGRNAHRSFLSQDEIGSNPILIIEDMALDNLSKRPEKVWISPLRFLGSDGAPVTIFAGV